MHELWYVAFAASVSAGTFLGLWLSEIVLRREWNRLHRTQKIVNDSLLELDRRREEWRQLQELTARSRKQM
jgi:hypothetical protein